MNHRLLFFLLILACAPAFAQNEDEPEVEVERIERGDVLLMEKVGRDPTGSVPSHGLKMSQVEAQYGEPVSRVAPIGDPPISRWVYDGFTVYFENDTVIHAVVEPRRGVS